VLTDGTSLLVFGGQDATHNSTASADQIDPGSGASTPLAALSPPVHDAAGVHLGTDNLIIAGGTPPPRATVQVVPSRGASQVRGQLPAVRTDHVAATIGTTIYVLGGAQNEGLPVASVFASSDAGTTWHDAGALAAPVRYPAVHAIKNSVYLFGGVTTANGTDTASVQRYDPTTHTTTVVAQLPAPLSHASAIAFGDVAFILGGFVNNVPSTEILRFDANTNRVTNVGTLPAPLTDAGATVISEVGYLVGGEGPGRSTTSHVEVLRPQ
jgi:non-specific serine/threonine protein kinase